MSPLTSVRFVRICASVAVAAAASLAAGRVLTAQSTDHSPLNSPGDYENADWSAYVSAHVAIVDGDVWIERDGRRDVAVENLPLLANDVIGTARGRVEIAFDDNAFVDMDEFTNVAFLDGDLAHLERGQIRVSLRGRHDYRVAAAGSTATLRSPGEYRLTLADPQVLDPEVRVAALQGSVDLDSAFGRIVIRNGFEATSSARGGPSRTYATNVMLGGSFDRWVATNRREWSAVSTRYLPDDLQIYDATLYSNGDWKYLSPYGYVWYPRVAYSWRPYYDGHWMFAASFGWMWVGGARWSWPTHHYGRWGQVNDRWYWIPGARWAPAWVSWASSPGYVGWCPLGYDNRPAMSIAAVTFWRGWTTVPSRAFTGVVSVGRYPQGSAYDSSRNFVPTRGGPPRPYGVRAESRPVAAPRNVTPRSTQSIDSRWAAQPPALAIRPDVPSRQGARPAGPAPRIIDASRSDPSPAPRLPSRPRAAEPRIPQGRPELPAPSGGSVRPRPSDGTGPAPPAPNGSQRSGTPPVARAEPQTGDTPSGSSSGNSSRQAAPRGR